MLIVLNDNEMSISPTVGALSSVPERDQAQRDVADEQAQVRLVGRADPGGRADRPGAQPAPAPLGRQLCPGRAGSSRTSGSRTSGSCPGTTSGSCSRRFSQALELPGPVIVHVRTQKGRGFQPAETDQIGFHGAALPPMAVPAAVNGNGAVAPGEAPVEAKMPTESMSDDAAPPTVAKPKAKNPNYTAVFVAELIELAKQDRRIVGITAGMPTGTGLSKFQAEFPDRFVDVGIAEQHSMALATGLAMGGMRPVVALYSTFLQRAFDQTVHDVCQNDQPVLLAVDRAGLVGEDGTSHQGMFTLPAQRQLPNLVIASPKDEQELRSLLHTALAQDHPFALHYPRDAGFGLAPVTPTNLPIGRGEVVARGYGRPLRRVRADRGPGARGGRDSGRRRLVGRRDQRPVREAAGPGADR